MIWICPCENQDSFCIAGFVFSALTLLVVQQEVHFLQFEILAKAH